MNQLLFALFLPLVACSSRVATNLVAASNASSAWNLERARSHPWFPLAERSHWTYAGTSDGQRLHERVEVLAGTTRIAGADCVAVSQTRHVDGLWQETTVQWFGATTDGSLWLFGEHTESADAARNDGWLAGRDGAKPVRWLPGAPQAGDRLTLRLPSGDEVLAVLAIDGRARTPAGTFSSCLVLAENPDDADEQDIILLAPGVGRIAEQDRRGALQLLEHR